MNATTVAVDLAKSVFQLAVADERWRVVETLRLARTQFERWFTNRDVSLVIMESCDSARHRARWLNGLGIEVKLLPAQYVRAYVKHDKTDAAGAAALLEAASDLFDAFRLGLLRCRSLGLQALDLLHHEIDECPYARRQQPSMRIQQAVRTRASAEGLQHLHQGAVGKLFLDDEFVGLKQAGAGLRQRHAAEHVLGA